MSSLVARAKPSSFSLDGAQLLARSFGLAAFFGVEWEQHAGNLAGPAWRPSEHVRNIWSHPEYAEHQVYVDNFNNGIWVLQRFIAKPDVDKVNGAATSFLGYAASTQYTVACPTRIWVPLVGGAAVQLRDGDLACHVVREFEPIVFATPAPGFQVRTVASRHGDRTARLWGEVLIGSDVQAKNGEPRSYLYAADIRRLTVMPPGVVPSFVGAAVCHLGVVLGVYRQQHPDLEVDTTPCIDHPRFGVAIEPTPGATAFDFTLRDGDGLDRYLVLGHPDRLTALSTDAERDALLSSWLTPTAPVSARTP